MKLENLNTSFLAGALRGDTKAETFSWLVEGKPATRAQVVAELKTRGGEEHLVMVEENRPKPGSVVEAPILVPDPADYMSEEDLLGLKAAIRNGHAPTATVDARGRKGN